MRADGGEARYAALIGPVVYRKDIDELSGDYLASYETQRIEVQLTDSEREAHDAERQLYLNFLRSHQIRMGSPTGWQDFSGCRKNRSQQHGARCCDSKSAKRGKIYNCAGNVPVATLLPAPVGIPGPYSCCRNRGVFYDRRHLGTQNSRA